MAPKRKQKSGIVNEMPITGGKGEHLFEVWQDGERKCSTDYKSCLYPEQTLRSMQSAGCTFKLFGKSISLKKYLEVINSDELFK